MKFLCLECDDVMDFAERQLPGDGTFTAVFSCGSCGREVAMLANPMETQMVSSMGVQIGGRELPEQPMELTRTSLADGRDEAFDLEASPEQAPGPTPSSGEADAPDGDGPEPAPDSASAAGSDEGRAPDTGSGPAVGQGSVEWSSEAVERLQKVPRFVRGMVKRIYTDYAQERGIARMTPETMDQARSDLGLEGM